MDIQQNYDNKKDGNKNGKEYHSSHKLPRLLAIYTHSIFSALQPPSQIFQLQTQKNSSMATNPFFKIHLTKEQKAVINSLLPGGMSLQPIPTPNHKPVGRPSLKQLSPLKSEEVSIGRSENESKRRRHKIVEEVDEEKNVQGKKQQINRYWQILKKMKRHESAWPFKCPVNAKELQIPDYFSIVLNPIDLQTIQNNFRRNLYDHPAEFQRDINQMFLNSYKFNYGNDTYFNCTAELEEFYNMLLKENQLEGERKRMPDRNKRKEDSNHRNHHDGERTNELAEVQKEISILLKKSIEFVGHKYDKQKTNNYSVRSQTPMNIQEKRQLGYHIRSLEPVHVESIAQMIMKNKVKVQNGNSQEGETVGIDLDKLDLKTLREIQNYIRVVQKKPEDSCQIREDLESGMNIQ